MDACNDACEQLGLVHPHRMTSPFARPFARELDLFVRRLRRRGRAEDAGARRARLSRGACPGGRHPGGTLCRATLVEPPPGREDGYRAPRSVPLGYGRYAPRGGAGPGDYLIFRVGGWRIACPRRGTGPADLRIKDRCIRALGWGGRGPLPAGFVRVGDTLVPEELGPGARRLAAASLGRRE